MKIIAGCVLVGDASNALFSHSSSLSEISRRSFYWEFYFPAPASFAFNICFMFRCTMIDGRKVIKNGV